MAAPRRHRHNFADFLAVYKLFKDCFSCSVVMHVKMARGAGTFIAELFYKQPRCFCVLVGGNGDVAGVTEVYRRLGKHF